MCMIDDGERYAVYHEGTQRAKRAYKCAECRREIPAGEVYRRTAGLYDGHWTVNKVCQHCAVACEWLGTNCGGYMDNGVLEDIEQHFDEYRRMDLARLAISMRRKWQRKRGGMMSVPALPRPLKIDDSRPWSTTTVMTQPPVSGENSK